MFLHLGMFNFALSILLNHPLPSKKPTDPRRTALACFHQQPKRSYRILYLLAFTLAIYLFHLQHGKVPRMLTIILHGNYAAMEAIA